MSARTALNDHLSDLAQRQLATLRAALETRLVNLEEVLADPSRGESLEGLILDLARVATEEAQAAASQACVGTMIEADGRIAEAWTSARATLESTQAALESTQRTLEATQAALQSAQAALEQEQEASSNLRLAIDQAQQHITGLERNKRAEIRAIREHLEAEVARERATAADLKRDVADAHAQLETERVLSVELRRTAERAEEEFKERLATLEHEQAQARAAHEALLTELARERDTAATLQRAHMEMQSRLEETQSQIDEAQSRLEAERASSADLRLAIAQADQRTSSLLHDKEHALVAHDQLAADLERERAETAMATVAVIDAQLELASARTEMEVLRADLDARQLHTSPGDEAAADVPASGDEGEWEAVRLANRYVFPEAIEIEVNCHTGSLLDLSIAGCQLLSPMTLKPNYPVKVLLPSEEGAIVCTGRVVWARQERPEAGQPPQYRAGVSFTKADELAIETFAASRSATA